MHWRRDLADRPGVRSAMPLNPTDSPPPCRGPDRRRVGARGASGRASHGTGGRVRTGTARNPSNRGRSGRLGRLRQQPAGAMGQVQVLCLPCRTHGHWHPAHGRRHDRQFSPTWFFGPYTRCAAYEAGTVLARDKVGRGRTACCALHARGCGATDRYAPTSEHERTYSSPESRYGPPPRWPRYGAYRPRTNRHYECAGCMAPSRSQPRSLSATPPVS